MDTYNYLRELKHHLDLFAKKQKISERLVELQLVEQKLKRQLESLEKSLQDLEQTQNSLQQLTAAFVALTERGLIAG